MLQTEQGALLRRYAPRWAFHMATVFGTTHEAILKPRRTRLNRVRMKKRRINCAALKQHPCQTFIRLCWWERLLPDYRPDYRLEYHVDDRRHLDRRHFRHHCLRHPRAALHGTFRGVHRPQ